MDHSTDHAMDHSADVHATMSAHDHGESPAPIAVTSLVLGAYFLVITPWWLVEIVGVTRRRRRIGRLGPKRSRAAVQRAAAVEAGVHALKSAGMGVMLLVAL
jgi:hypothetical protein